MDIQSKINEYKAIVKEIQTRSIEISKFKKRKDVLEKDIMNYLDEADKPGVKYKNTAIIAEEKSRRIRKNKQEKISACIDVLNQHGIGGNEAQRLYNEIFEAIKGDKEYKKKLLIKDI